MCGIAAGVVIYVVLILLLMPNLLAEVVPMLPARLRDAALVRLPGLATGPRAG
jgi:hypothetical protein